MSAKSETYLNFDVTDRHNKLIEFGDLLTYKIKDQTYKGPFCDDKTILVSSGYNIWKSVVESTFPVNLPLSEAWLSYKNSSVWRNGFSASSSGISKELLEEINLVFHEGRAKLNQTERTSESSFSINKIFSDKTGWITGVIKDIIQAWESFYLPKDLILLPWRFHGYTTRPGSINPSLNWHYDTNITDNVLFFMLNLTDCMDSDNAGTYFIDARRSAQISLVTDYISAPIMHRAEKLEYLGIHEESNNASFLPATAGNLVAFHPGRTLHKGSCGNVAQRDNLHIATIITERSSRIKANFEGLEIDGPSKDLKDILWEKAGENFANTTTGAPFYCQGRK